MLSEHLICRFDKHGFWPATMFCGKGEDKACQFTKQFSTKYREWPKPYHFGKSIIKMNFQLQTQVFVKSGMDKINLHLS